MVASKTLQLSLIISTVLLLAVQKVNAQKLDEATYQHKMRLIDSLSMYNMKAYDTLYKISLSYDLWGNEFRNVCYGWIQKQTQGQILFLHTNGKETEIEKKQVTGISKLPVNDSVINIFIKEREDPFSRLSFGGNYLFCLWLFKKGEFDYSKRLLPDNNEYFSDDHLRNDFGIIYYDDMLSAFSKDRNYQQAITFGNHLSGNIFTGYEYQKEATALTLQLNKDTGDYKSFHLPDSIEWVALKQKLNRKEQVFYLADRLRLLNCIQLSQPGGISYDMPQFSISFAEAAKLNIDYWNQNTRYKVINPVIELLKMKLNLRETELLLPYLLSDDYIASYSYFRDFRSERTLHKHSWVVHELLFEITNNLFFYQRSFDSLSFDKKKLEVEKIRKWCDDNASMSKEDLVINTLKTTNDWNNFKKALATAKEEKYSSMLPAIIGRYADFNNFHWPVHKHLIAETVYELGNESYLETVKNWNTDTTDLDVRLYTSLFLLKYDRSGYEHAMTGLESVLKNDDGTYYYPHAMDLLLSMNNDKRAFKLAEGILNKERFHEFIDWDYYLNFVKKLLLLKSDYTFNFINEKIKSFTSDETASFNKSNGNVNMMTQNDAFVLAVDQLKSNKPGYDFKSGLEVRLEYKKALSKWFVAQYNLLKQGKPNELHLELAKVNAPVTFVDAPGN